MTGELHNFADARRFVVVAVPGRRIDLFNEALRRRGLPPAVVVPWLDVIERRADLRDIVRAGDIVRIESPGKHFETEKALLVAGGVGAATIKFERGRIWWPERWYAGFTATLNELGRQLDGCAGYVRMSAPEEIAVMFDKRQCHARLSEAGVHVPPGLGEVGSYDQLIARMRDAGCSRAFIKSAHGSSASGVIAYQTDGKRELVKTTVEMGWEGGELKFYNSRIIRNSSDRRIIAQLIDALCCQNVHVERWLPKAGVSGHSFDLRVVVIAGRARHVVVRMSRSPMTNLHLLNKRGDVDAVREHVGDCIWNEALRQAERAMAAFPRSLYGGVDVMITADHRRAAVLEVNAFGDLLPGVLWNGMETYDAEIAEMLARPTCDARVPQEAA